MVNVPAPSRAVQKGEFMFDHLFRLGNRTRSTAACATLLTAAVLIAAPTPARAKTGRTASVLAEGAGMGPRPSASVRAVQRTLDHRRYELGPAGVDGRFGQWTDAAVRRLQEDHGLAVDGVVGNHTRMALRPPPRSHASREGEAAPVYEGPPTPRPVARLAPGRNVSADLPEFSDGRPGAAIAAGAVGALSAATAALALSLGRGRRRRGRWTISSRGLPDIANGTPRARQDENPDTWMRYIDRHDAAGPIRAAAADKAPPPSELPGGRAVIGYVTLSANLGSGEAGRSSAAIQATCERSGWNLLEIVGDRDNGRVLERPGLGYALGRIADGQACGLVVSDLQRLGRSIVDLGALMAWFRDANATLIALDLGIDTSTAEGERVASTLIALSARAHERIADRTRNRLAERRANGHSNGRPAVRDRPELMERIAAMRAGGLSLQAIADQLNAENVPTLRGGAKWRPSSIQAALGYRRPGPRDHLPRLTPDRP